MAYKSNLTFGAVIVSILVLVWMFMSAIPTHAGPPSFLVAASTASATTTLLYQTPGTATTSLVYDAAKYGGSSEVNGYSFFTVEVQYSASSSALSTLTMTIERASANGTDCGVTPAACDWYVDNSLLGKSMDATTTPTTDVSNGNTLKWTFASSSQGAGAVLVTNNRAMKSFTVPVLSRFTRVNFTQTGTTNGAIWADLLGIKSRF